MKTWAKFTTFSGARARMRRARLSVSGEGAEALPVLTLVAAALTLALLAGVQVHRQTEPATEQDAVRQNPPAAKNAYSLATSRTEHGSVEVRTDAANRVVLVRGHDPRAVLLGYCRASGAKRRAVELVSINPLETGVQMGLFWDLDGLQAVQIRQDAGSLEWITGDGSNPVATRPADRLRLAGPRVSV